MPTYDLGLEHVSLAFATKTIFTDVTQGVFEGDRIGIVGRNGDGKSTLLHLFKGTQEPDSGRVTKRGGLTFGMLDQRDPLDDDATVRAAALEGREDYEWAADNKSREIVEALLGGINLNARVGSLSGGQRRRADLARLLLKDWDILALDEPTNHLDVVTIHWLAEHLKNRWSKGQGALLLVTHDRWFLDEVCESMWEVHDGVIDPFEGGYSAYMLQRVERDRQADVRETKRRNLARKELAWLSRGARARSTKQKFHVKAARELSADVGPGDRFGIVGANGAGKSTLLKLIDGTLTPTAGHVNIGKTVKFAVLSQRLDELEKLGKYKIKEVLSRYKPSYIVDGKEVTPGQLMERLGFESAQLMTPIRDLSGGQKRRMQLLLILLDEPNVLIMDEPGNDLDTDMLAVMEDLLDTWPGTLIVVSHDRYLLERVTDQQFALIGGKVRHLPGGVDDYLDMIEKAKTAAPAGVSASQKEPADSGVTATADDAPKLSGKEFRETSKRISAIERKLAKLEEQKTALEADMAAHDPSDYEGLNKLNGQLQAVSDESGALEAEWMELSEKLE